MINEKGKYNKEDTDDDQNKMSGEQEMISRREANNKKLGLFHSTYSQNQSSQTDFFVLIPGIPYLSTVWHSFCKLKIVHMVMAGNFEVMSDVIQILQIYTRGNYA